MKSIKNRFHDRGHTLERELGNRRRGSPRGSRDLPTPRCVSSCRGNRGKGSARPTDTDNTTAASTRRAEPVGSLSALLLNRRLHPRPLGGCKNTPAKS
eukprot:scaffold204861_cov34-Tisochrysis_lutea.AAC.2